MLFEKSIRTTINKQRYGDPFIWIIPISLFICGCYSPNDYLGRGQLIDSPDSSTYDSTTNQHQYPQNGTDQWQNPDSGLNQPNGINQQTDMNVPGMYDYQTPQYSQAANPQFQNQNLPNNGVNGLPENPPLNTGRQTAGFSSSGDNRYLDAHTRQAIENMRTSQQKTVENPPYQDTLTSNNPPPAGNPVVTNVGVSENGIPAGAANPTQIEHIGNPAIALAHPSASGLAANQQKQTYNSSAGVSANQQLPTLQVPVPQGINRNYLTRPAVSMSAPNYAAPENIIQMKERWLAEHPDDINTALALYYHYLAEENQQKAQSFLPQDFNQAERAQQALKNLNQQISERNLLKITNLKICEKVEGFGRYAELPLSELQSGKSRWIEVYFELENYANRLNPDGAYSSELHAEITLYDGSYRPVITPLSEDVPPKPTYSPRKDFFLVGTIQLPALNPGPYIITVQVEDKIANKRSRRKELVFHVGTNLTTNNYQMPTIR